MIRESQTRQERIIQLQRAIELGDEYERTYTKEMEFRREIRQKQEDRIKRLLGMTDEEYEKQPI